ncbi:hypothetical protein [Pseudoalteromonas sp. MMG012]|uniref:hypothetical protein n=1 Tax=Pseudoalteromonas sp. MMG012 TaxID=2822686 RepID=UPI001B3A6AD8|nr:hypothetical protein [Pseudoalteromonas sp. MMG012]MBQ4851147.1 hypothetical protein [Pseudoalteromonas sp. MMG012]
MELNNASSVSENESDEIKFYVVSQRKFLILFIATMGMYGVYWFFKHWNEYKKSTNDDMWPIARGIFSIFFTHALFALFEMKYEQKTGNAPKSFNHFATIYVVVVIGSNISSQLSDHGYGNPITLCLGLLMYPISCWVLYQAQSLANYAGEDVNGASNSKLTALNYVWLILGSLLWGLMIIGIYVTFINT